MTPNPPRLDASSAPGAIQVEHCDVPAHMTLDEWRRHCAAERHAAEQTARSGRRRGLRRLFGG
ncbi:MAG: hypothetical protein M3320_09200 [Actinomycetota bacterium]|nr:hypothetical protein [Actinomycetota bacterium]